MKTITSWPDREPDWTMAILKRRHVPTAEFTKRHPLLVSRIPMEKHVLELLRSVSRPGESILDYGCGTGYLVELLKGYRYNGWDISPSLMAENWTRDPLHFVEPTGTYDVVLASAMLHHSKDPSLVLQDMKRFCSRVAIVARIPIMDRGPSLVGYSGDYPLHLFSELDVTQAMQASGFQVSEMHFAGLTWKVEGHGEAHIKSYVLSV